jgi:hypothetical protein
MRSGTAWKRRSNYFESSDHAAGGNNPDSVEILIGILRIDKVNVERYTVVCPNVTAVMPGFDDRISLRATGQLA